MGFIADEVFSNDNENVSPNKERINRENKEENKMAPSFSSGSDEISTEQGFMVKKY